jgi:F420-dependent oxidoreductase-like protein
VGVPRSREATTGEVGQTSVVLPPVDFRVYVEPEQSASYTDQLAVAQTAEALGFSGFFRSDHYLAMSGGGLPGPTDSWMTLGAIARETSSIRLGTLVTSATFRHPGPLAVSVAQVDEMSNGRVELGIGAGWFEPEHLAYAIPFPPSGERFARLTEQLEIITGLWTTPVGKTFDYNGRYYTVSDCPALQKPMQRPHPPIIIGGLGAKRTPALAATFADEFNVPFASLETIQSQYRRVHAMVESDGRSADSMTYSAAFVVCAGRDDTEVSERVGALGRDFEKMLPILRSWGYQAISSSPLVGTPGQIVDRLGPFAATGMQRVYLRLVDLSDLDHLEVFAAEVMRQL